MQKSIWSDLHDFLVKNLVIPLYPNEIQPAAQVLGQAQADAVLITGFIIALFIEDYPSVHIEQADIYHL
jgi:hypothetical protein